MFGQLVYLLLLSLVTIVMAISTRKIKLENFKDTKKIVALTILLSSSDPS